MRVKRILAMGPVAWFLFLSGEKIVVEISIEYKQERLGV